MTYGVFLDSCKSVPSSLDTRNVWEIIKLRDFESREEAVEFLLAMSNGEFAEFFGEVEWTVPDVDLPEGYHYMNYYVSKEYM